MAEPTSIIAERVRERVLRDGVDLSRDGEAAGRYVREEVRRYSERALGGVLPPLDDEARASAEIVAALTGFGPLQPLLDDPGIEEIWINAPDRVFVSRAGVSSPVRLGLTERGIRDLVDRMLQSSGRRVDLSSPFVDAVLPDGSRLHVVIAGVARRHAAINIRKFDRRIRDLDQLVAAGSLTDGAAAFLRACVLSGQSILVSGATQSGKTTLLNALLSAMPERTRIVTVEEVFELDFDAEDAVALQCRPPSLEGGGEIPLRRLVKEALRMRPDRLVVGEVREAEALDLLIALNSGLPGMCSIHANTAQDALAKLCTLPLLAGQNISSAFIVPAVAGCVGIVAHLELRPDGSRRLAEIVAPTGRVVGGAVEAEPIFRSADGRLEPTGRVPARRDGFAAAGIDIAGLLGATAA